MSVALLTVVVVGLTSCRSSAPSAGALPLRTVAELALPGSASRFDYQDIDPTTNRLFIAHLGASQIDVVDLTTTTVVATIPDITSVHGVRVAPDLGRLYASATGDNTVVTIDTHTLAILARAPTGLFPDGLAYDPETKKVFVSNEEDHLETVLDANTGQPVGNTDIGGEAGNTATDMTGNQVLVDVQTANDIAIIDPATLQITGRIALPGCQHDHGLYIDSPHQLAFVACDDNNVLLTLDLTTRTITGTYPVGDNPDVLAFDPHRARLYVAAESSVLAVFDESGRTVRPVSRALYAPHAHTIAVDSETSRVYLPLENDRGSPHLRVGDPT